MEGGKEGPIHKRQGKKKKKWSFSILNRPPINWKFINCTCNMRTGGTIIKKERERERKFHSKGKFKFCFFFIGWGEGNVDGQRGQNNKIH